MSYPPRYGPPQRQPGYPQQYPHGGQRPAYPAPQPGYPAQYAATPRYQPPPPPPAPRRRKPNKVVYFVSLFLCLGIAGVAGVSAFSANEPQAGDCLAGTEKRFFGGLEIVDCGSADAKYKVVAHVDNGRGACRNYSGGGETEEIIDSGRKRKVYWSICVTPT